ncbi:MAG: ketoacyl-ACP synthase III [Gammaproteobacteria bacterium]|nr:ketoacyl-ACP synthase III [Gammaproteobacteria bacterium]
MQYAEITGWGKCVPPAVLSNEDLATFIDTSDEWITTRTGIKERRVCHCNFSDMALVAAKHALAAADLDPMELDLILLGSLTNDSYCPNTASIIADGLGARKAAAIDINSACTGFLYGLHIGTNLIRAGAHKKILVIGGEFITHYMNWSQRDVAVLFGDACGAVVIEESEKETGLLAAKIGCESDAKFAIQITNLGSAYSRLSDEHLYNGWNFGGQEVFKRAVKSMAQACEDVLESTGMSLDDIKLVVPHQANKRILNALAKRIGISEDRVFVNVHKYGNTSAGTIPVALSEALEEKKIEPGDHLLLASFGAGLTWGAGLVRWSDRVNPLKESDADLPPCDKTALEIIQPHIERYLAHQNAST